jgi:hypothetical protein
MKCKPSTTVHKRFESVHPDHSEVLGEFVDIRLNYTLEAKIAVSYWGNWAAFSTVQGK